MTLIHSGTEEGGRSIPVEYTVLIDVDPRRNPDYIFQFITKHPQNNDFLMRADFVNWRFLTVEPIPSDIARGANTVEDYYEKIGVKDSTKKGIMNIGGLPATVFTGYGMLGNADEICFLYNNILFTIIQSEISPNSIQLNPITKKIAQSWKFLDAK